MGTIDLITIGVAFFPWLIWLVWEIVLLVIRHRGTKVKTISMAAQWIAYNGLPTLAYFWGGMTSHYFLNWTRPVWSVPWFGAFFWLVGLAYLLTDIFFRPPRENWPKVVRWLRWPPVVVLIGLVLGYVCFPQRAMWLP